MQQHRLNLQRGALLPASQPSRPPAAATGAQEPSAWHWKQVGAPREPMAMAAGAPKDNDVRFVGLPCCSICGSSTSYSHIPREHRPAIEVAAEAGTAPVQAI
mmetsp:Transcript_16740/g.52378  ORF Transcript_16740/g.52378 Transcript_16740/m.52378 type:complete len:102 (-) Transcript_16740:30-335(-)